MKSGLEGPQTQELIRDFWTSLSGRNDTRSNWEEIITIIKYILQKEFIYE
jgi:hypothetical protein